MKEERKEEEGGRVSTPAHTHYICHQGLRDNFPR